jgi:hypothetical protein
MKAMFPPVLASFLKTRHTTLFMLACGALVTNAESYSHLTQSAAGWVLPRILIVNFSNHRAISMAVDELVAFTAPEFHAVLTTSFFVDFAYRVLIEGFSLSYSFKPMLAACSQSSLARHTSIVHVHFENGGIAYSKEYVFSHEKWRPWGYRLPASCNGCSSPLSWKDPVKSKSTYIFNCRNVDCREVCSFEKPPHFVPFSSDVAGGRWMVRDYVIW